MFKNNKLHLLVLFLLLFIMSFSQITYSQEKEEEELILVLLFDNLTKVEDKINDGGYVLSEIKDKNGKIIGTSFEEIKKPGIYDLYYSKNDTIDKKIKKKLYAIKVFLDVDRNGELKDDSAEFLPGSRIESGDYSANAGNYEISVNTSGEFKYQKLHLLTYPIDISLITKYYIRLALTSKNSGASFSEKKNQHKILVKKENIVNDIATIPLWIKDTAANVTLAVEYVRKDASASYRSLKKGIPMDGDADGIPDIWEWKMYDR